MALCPDGHNSEVYWRNVGQPCALLQKRWETKMGNRTVLAGALVAGLASAALAGPPGGEEKPGRFTMQPTDGGLLRLDTVTGDVSLCARTGSSFECKPVKDDRDLQSEVARLADENKQLKAEIRRLEESLGLDGSLGRPKPKLELPSEEDVDKALSYLERMFKKFRDKLKEFDSPGSPSNGKGTPL